MRKSRVWQNEKNKKVTLKYSQLFIRITYSLLVCIHDEVILQNEKIKFENVKTKNRILWS